MPGVHGEAAARDGLRMLLGEGEECGDIELKMARGVGREVRGGEGKEAHGGAQAAAVLWVRRVGALFLQVDECAGELDEALEKGMVGAARGEPEVFEHIVRFVILLRIKAGEVALVARVQGEGGVGAEAGDEVFDAVAFFHRAVAEET